MNKTKKEILNKIKKGEVKMKPKWWFEAEKVGINTGWVILMILGAVMGSTMLLFWELYNPIDLLSYGEVGRQLLWEDFPFWQLFLTVISIILAEKLIRNVGTWYRIKPLWMWLTIGVTMSLTIGVFFIMRS